MRRSRVVAALLAAPLVGLFLAGTPSAQAAPTALPVTGVTLSRTTVAVSGLNTVPVNVTVNADATDTDLVLNVILERTAGSGPLKYMFSTDLKRTGGTAEHGIWTGPLNVASTANGTFKVTGVVPGPYGAPDTGFPPEPTPYDGPTITVTGTHLPKITASVSPKVVPVGSPYSIRWAVTDAQTGKAYGTRITVGLGVDSPCAEGGAALYRTDTNGLVTKSYLATDANWVNCLQVPGKPYTINALGLAVARSGAVSAAPSKTSAPVGTIVPVNGSVGGAPSNCSVNLQRLYGATQWRTVGTAKIRLSGRFTVNAQPAYKGLIPYRVSFPACGNFVAAVSKVFYIRGL